MFCFILKNKAQNLVPNFSFEQKYDCVNATLSNAKEWCSVSNNCPYFFACQTDPLFTTPHQYDNINPNPCYDKLYQVAKTGDAYTTFYGYITTSTITPNRYAHTKLKDTLRVGKSYCVSFYLNLFNYSQYSTDKLSALLTPNAFPCVTPTSPSFTLTGYTPQIVSPAGVQLADTLNWMEVSGVYTALGNEAYLTIGDFFPQSQHSIIMSYPSNCNANAEYYVDDVSVEEVHLAKCARDTAICPNDSVIIGNNVSESTTYNWQPISGLSCTNCANPKASPNVTTTYTLTKTQCKAITTASITVTIKTDCTPKVILSEIPNVFTPNGDGVNDTFNFTIVGASDVSFTVYDRWGLEVASNPSPSGRLGGAWDGHTTSGVECSEGIYFYTLEYKDAKGDTQKKNGYVSLFR